MTSGPHCRTCNDTGLWPPSAVSCPDCRSERTDAAYWFLNDGMLQKLLENTGKGHWHACRAEWLLGRLEEETRELRMAMNGGDAEEILREAADVANFAMMIADNARRKP